MNVDPPPSRAPWSSGVSTPIEVYRCAKVSWSIGMPVASPSTNAHAKSSEVPTSFWGVESCLCDSPLDVVELLLGVGPPDTRVPRAERQALEAL
jgi:hypothetical protein